MGKSRHQSHQSSFEDGQERNSSKKRKRVPSLWFKGNKYNESVDVANKSKARQQSKKYLKEFILEDEENDDNGGPYWEEM